MQGSHRQRIQGAKKEKGRRGYLNEVDGGGRWRRSSDRQLDLEERADGEGDRSKRGSLLWNGMAENRRKNGFFTRGGNSGKLKNE